MVKGILEAGTLEKIDFKAKHMILDSASRIRFGKEYGDLDDMEKERIWINLEGDLE